MSQFASTLYPQTNPSNQILLELRSGLRNNEGLPMSYWVGVYMSTLPEMDYGDVGHARKVLSRLASLTG
ncbi:hypothetical protein GCM10009651_36620 [Microbacterium natoriense]